MIQSYSQTRFIWARVRFLLAIAVGILTSNCEDAVPTTQGSGHAGSVTDSGTGARNNVSGTASIDSNAGAPGSSGETSLGGASGSAGAPNSSGGASGGHAGSSQCSADCAGATAIEILAFYTVYDQMADLAHRSYSREANEWFPRVAQDNGFTYESTTDWNRLKSVTPDKGRVIMFFDNAPWDGEQRAAFKSYVENGGGWIGFHVSAYNDSSSTWAWFYDEFLGCGKFKGNTWRPTSAKLKVDDTAHPATQGLDPIFESAPNEWYSWQVDLRTKSNIKILCSIDPSSFPLGTGPKPHEVWHSGYYPVVWSNTDYKMVYINMGHNDMDYAANKPLSSTFSSDAQNQLLLNAIRFVAGAN